MIIKLTYMGIDGYHKWMRENHSKAFDKEWLDTYDHIYIDINFALHYCHFGAKTEKEIIGKLIWFLEIIISKFFPTKSIVLANDGPAPLAKLLLQRERRAGSARSITNLETSSLIFTPGTKFMNTIESKLEMYINKIKMIYKIKVDFMIGCEGEAELKLKKRMGENIIAYLNDTHLIVSNDADIIAMFGTFPQHSYHNVFICTNVGANAKKECEIISFGTLMQLHTEKYGKTKNYGLDFTLLSTMVGNDYLPKILYTDLDKLMTAYQHAIYFEQDGLILNDCKLNITFFIRLLNGVLAQTKIQYANNITKNNHNPSLYKNYMDGLLWCLDMYNQGQCTRYNYMYENDEPPHPFALILHIDENPKICELSTSKYPAIDSNLYAVLVMPKCALVLIDSKYHSFAEKCDILYEKELCKKCNAYYAKLVELKSDSTEYKELRKEIKAHDATHVRIVADDIMQLLSLA